MACLRQCFCSSHRRATLLLSLIPIFQWVKGTLVTVSIYTLVPPTFVWQKSHSSNRTEGHVCNTLLTPGIAATWYSTPSIGSLFGGSRQDTKNRILNYSSSALGTSFGDGCDLSRHPWPGDPKHQAPRGWTQLRWPAGPGQPPSTNRQRPHNGDAYSSMVGVAAESSSQRQPLSQGQSNLWPAVAPPVRAAEPFTVEHWIVFMQPRQAGLSLLTNQMQMWSRTGNNVPSGARADPASLMASGFPFQPDTQVQTSSQLMLFRGTTDRFNLVCASASVVECPRRTFDPDCTPAGVPIPLNDTCRQTVLWPTTYGYIRGTKSNASRCPSPIVPFTGPLDGFNQLRRGHQGAPDGWVHAAATCTGRAIKPVARHGLSSMAYTLTWQQSVTTIWPPGTVAVLPVGPNATASGDAPDYPWRVNRGHVVTQTVNTPATRLQQDEMENVSPNDAVSYKPMQCGAYVGLAPVAPDAQLVFLEDVNCIQTRSCRPDVGSEVDSASTGYRKTVNAYVASNIRQLFPTGLVGCALTYSLDRDIFNADLLPVDMPIAQNGAGFSIGSIVRNYLPRDNYIPAVRGRWSNESSTGTSGGGQPVAQATVARPRSAAARFGQTSQHQSPIMSNALLHGPYAVFRGPALLRAVPPHPNVSLPNVRGGSWKCSRTYPQGYFQERPRCIAVCNNPSHLAVDVGLENDASLAAAGIGAGADGADRDGWALVATQSRQWYSYWVGYPSLVLNEKIYGNDRLAQVPALGTVRPATDGVPPPTYDSSSPQDYPSGAPLKPQLRCMPDDNNSWQRSWSRKSRWAQRLPVSRGHIDFVLSFDASAWPAAVPLGGQGQPPGLDWPKPTVQQLKWLAGDIEMDVDDIIGASVFPESPVACSASVLHVSPGRASLKPNCSEQDMSNGWCYSLPQRISVRLYCDVPRQDEAPLNAGGGENQRSLTPGSVLQRIARRIRGSTAAGLAGAWLVAAEPSSIDVCISLPEIPAVETALAASRRGGCQSRQLHPTTFSLTFYPALATISAAVLGAAWLHVSMSAQYAVPLSTAWALICMQVVLLALPFAFRVAKLQWPALYLCLGLAAGGIARGLVLLCCMYPILFSSKQSKLGELAAIGSPGDGPRLTYSPRGASFQRQSQAENRLQQKAPYRAGAGALLKSQSSLRHPSQLRSDSAEDRTGSTRGRKHARSGQFNSLASGPRSRYSGLCLDQEFPSAAVAQAYQQQQQQQQQGPELAGDKNAATSQPQCPPEPQHNTRGAVNQLDTPGPDRMLANLLSVDSSSSSSTMPPVLYGPASPARLRHGGVQHALESSSGEGSLGRHFVLDESDGSLNFEQRPSAPVSPFPLRVPATPSIAMFGRPAPAAQRAGGRARPQRPGGRVFVPVEDSTEGDGRAHPVFDSSTPPEDLGDQTQSAVGSPCIPDPLPGEKDAAQSRGHRHMDRWSSDSQSGAQVEPISAANTSTEGGNITSWSAVGFPRQPTIGRAQAHASESCSLASSNSPDQIYQGGTPSPSLASRVASRTRRNSFELASRAQHVDRDSSVGCMLQPGGGNSSFSLQPPRPSCSTLNSGVVLNPEADSDEVASDSDGRSSRPGGRSGAREPAKPAGGGALEPSTQARNEYQIAGMPMFPPRMFNNAYPRVIHGLGAALAVLQWDALEGSMEAFDAAKAGEWCCCRGREYHVFPGEASLTDRLLMYDNSSGGGGRTVVAPPAAMHTSRKQGTSRWTRHAPERGSRTAGKAQRGWASLVFRLYDVAIVSSALVWAALCTTGQCPVGACLDDPDSALAWMPPVLLLWDRVVIVGVAVGASVAACVAILILKR